MKQREKEILKILEDFRDTLENELIEQQNENKKIKIKDIKFIGQAKWQDKNSGEQLSKNVFIVEKEIIEIDEAGNERTTEQINYYLDDECIGGAIGDNGIIYGQNFQEADIEKFNAVNELLENTPEEEIENNSLNSLNRKELAEVLTAHTGKKVSEEEVEKVLEDMDKDEIEKLKEQKEENESKDESDLTEKQTENIKVNGIQKADLNMLVDGKETLGQRLDLEEYDNIYVVYSEKVDEITSGLDINNTTYSLVGVKKDGEAKVLNDEFEMDRSVGSIPSKQQTKLRADGTATRDNNDLSVYTRKSNGVSIGCENNQGNVEMFMYQKTFEENENVGIQIETSQTPIIPIETREIMNREKGQYQYDKVQDEVKEHTDNKCEPDKTQDYDGVENTETHEHSVNEKIDELVTEIYNYEDEYGDEVIKEVFTEAEVKDKLLREIHQYKDSLSIEQIVQNVKDEMNNDAQTFEREHKM